MERECLFFLYFDKLLPQEQRDDRARRVSEGRLTILFPTADFPASHYIFEMLLDPGHASVVTLRRDDASGARIKTFAPADTTADERELTAFVNRCVSELAASLVRRGSSSLAAISSGELVKMMKNALDAIVCEENVVHVGSLFPTFHAREKNF
ncbi:MAG: hypothetical protein LBI87_05340 [Candidatus Accumulibacter sp.]|nr:hypothetical protein [Accumulibacter sp.]